ncbi:MAG: hypothetical protein ACE5JA_11300, partial [bacterium]
MSSNFSLHLTRGHFLILFLLVLAAALFSYFFYRRRPSGTIGREWPLAILRGAGLSLLLLALFEPLVGMVLSLRQKPMVPVLVDTSGSMSIDDVSPDRLHAALRLLKTELMPSLRKKAEVSLLAFSDHVEAAAESLSPSGGVTNIAGSIREVSGVLGRSPSALVLVTDGNSNVGENPVDVAMEAGFPVYAIGVGDPAMKKDVLVKTIRTNEVAYTGDRIPVEAGVESKGFEGEKTLVSVYEGNRRLGKKDITLSGSKQEQSVTFELNPKTPGLHTYRIVVDPLEGELTEDNNSRAFAMRVLKSKINVLFIGRPCWDAKFLMRGCSSDKNVAMSQLILLDESRYLLREHKKEGPGRLPKSRSELSRYDVLVIHSPGKGQISEELGSHISDFVSSDGNGLLLLGEMSNLPASLQPLLPVIIGGHLRRNAKFEVTPEGLAHPAIALSDEMYESESTWKGLPPVYVEERAIGLNAGATAMAVDPATI